MPVRNVTRREAEFIASILLYEMPILVKQMLIDYLLHIRNIDNFLAQFGYDEIRKQHYQDAVDLWNQRHPDFPMTVGHFEFEVPEKMGMIDPRTKTILKWSDEVENFLYNIAPDVDREINWYLANILYFENVRYKLSDLTRPLTDERIAEYAGKEIEKPFEPLPDDIVEQIDIIEVREKEVKTDISTTAGHVIEVDMTKAITQFQNIHDSILDRISGLVTDVKGISDVLSTYVDTLMSKVDTLLSNSFLTIREIMKDTISTTLDRILETVQTITSVYHAEFMSLYNTVQKVILRNFDIIDMLINRVTEFVKTTQETYQKLLSATLFRIEETVKPISPVDMSIAEYLKKIADYISQLVSFDLDEVIKFIMDMLHKLHRELTVE